MNKTVWSGAAGFVTGAVIVFILMKGPLNQSGTNVVPLVSQESVPVESKQVQPVSGKTTQNDLSRNARPQVPEDQEILYESASALVADTAPEEADTEEQQDDIMTIVVTNPDDIAATVNGQPVGMNDIMPPGVLDPGSNLPEETYNGFLNQAIDQTLLVQRAQEMGIANDDDMARIAESMRRDLIEIGSNESPEEIEWEVSNFTRRAVINELLTQEGLIPKIIGNDEVDEYYESHSDEYFWLREREAAKGITDPEQIETFVRLQIRQDLMIPLTREAAKRKKAYIQTLRDSADINWIQ